MSRSFVAGVVVGGFIVWRWREEIEDCVSAWTRGVRGRVADGLQSVEETAECVLDRTAQPLRRADRALDRAKVRVRETLRAGQQAIRPDRHPEDRG